MSSAEAPEIRGGLAFGPLWRIARRDLGRNRRRSLLSMLAVALGLALLIAFNGLINGVMDDMRDNTIRYDTGHLQLRRPDYDADSLSLRGSELVDDLDARLARLRAMDGVRVASPVLWIRGLMTGAEESVDLRLIGIDPESELHAPFRDALAAGDFLSADDRDGVLIGRRLAEKMGLAPGDKAPLAVVDAEGKLDEGLFTVRGVFDTGLIVYDESVALMSLSKAQAFGQARGRASAIVLLLDRADDAARLAATLDEPGLRALSWLDLNELLGYYLGTVKRFYWLLDAIVMLVVAVVIANTLLMAVFERIREFGVMKALGVGPWLVMRVILVESALQLGIATLLGLVLAAPFAFALQVHGLDMTMLAGATVMGLSSPAVWKGSFTPAVVAQPVIVLLVVVGASVLWPAWRAARLRPLDAMRAT
ncbi:MAG: ABC transporter permease [Myxococcales bacterium]|nr:ABC transporter permease [Myxococcales bacterium]